MKCTVYSSTSCSNVRFSVQPESVQVSTRPGYGFLSSLANGPIVLIHVTRSIFTVFFLKFPPARPIRSLVFNHHVVHKLFSQGRALIPHTFPFYLACFLGDWDAFLSVEWSSGTGIPLSSYILWLTLCCTTGNCIELLVTIMTGCVRAYYPLFFMNRRLGRSRIASYKY